MANRKISELPSTNTVEDGDLVPVVDSSASETKKIQVSNLLSNTVKVDDSRLTDARVPTAHTHNTSQIPGLNTAVNNVIVNNGGGSSDANLLNRANHTGTQDHSTITGLGDASTKSVGTGPLNVVQLNSEGKLPAVDGSLLTGVPLILA